MKIRTLTLTALGFTAGTFFLLSTAKSKPLKVPSYSVDKVIDGDTFITKEKQYIRVSSIEAPELDKCGGRQAKKALEKLILNKPVYLKVLYLDPYKRLVSLVYTPDTFVNEAMLEKGNSYYYNRVSPDDIAAKLREAADKAREGKKGIFSNTCSQWQNPKNPGCSIKGNTRNGNIYYLPECGFYNQVQVQLYLGDRWFCTKQEAVNAGFRPPSQCP